MTRAQRILIVDDDRNLTTLLSTILQLDGLEVLSAPDGESALRMIETEPVDAIVLDLRMPGMDGRSVFKEMRARGNQAPVLIASAYGARAAQQELGAQGAIEKPFDPDALVDAVLELLREDASGS